MKNTPVLQTVYKEQNKYQVQVLYTQINRKKNGKVRFKSYRYGLAEDTYFYPASTVKLAAVVAAMEKKNSISGLSLNTPMLTTADYTGHTPVFQDATSATGLPSIGHYAKKILIVSDNDAYNRLYEFIGQDAFNQTLKSRGLSNSRIFHRLSVGMNAEQNRRTNPISFIEQGRVVHSQPQVLSSGEYINKEPILMGKGYYKGEELIQQPFDFADKNFFPLADQQKLLKAIFFPETLKSTERFDLNEADYQFLKQYMSQYPSETRFPDYTPDSLPDATGKMVMFGTSKEPIPKHIRVFNKLGGAYGHLIENAYVVDYKTGVEFMYSATILCNEDGVFNDDKYEYDSIGLPFHADLGQAIYAYELKRKRKNKIAFEKITYDQ